MAWLAFNRARARYDVALSPGKRGAGHLGGHFGDVPKAPFHSAGLPVADSIVKPLCVNS